MTILECPDSQTLRAFALGQLSDAELDHVAEHVERCPACESSLTTLDDETDELLTDLRHAGGDAPTPKAPVPVELIETVRTALEDDGRLRRDLIIDVGRKISRELEDGPFRLGRFELIEQLGVGSFGYVFGAHDTELDRTVAIKVQRAGTLATEEENERFLREARSAAQLEHQNIVSLYEIGRTDEGACYLVCEYVEGRTLAEWLRDHSPNPREAARLMIDIAGALGHAHRAGIVHRDIKPSNIMMDAAGQPHVMDFGLAKRDTGEATVTDGDEVMGTPAYMSPEQAAGDSHHVDARSDVFSLGVMLFELLTGDRPFHGNRRLLLLQLLEDEPPLPRRLNERIPRDLETICLKAMAKSPTQRYRDASELAADLERFAEGRPILARRAGLARRLRYWCRANPLAASLFLAVTLGSTAGMLYLSSLSHRFVQETALSSAEMQSEMLEEMNTFYSEIVEQLDSTDIDVTHQYLGRNGAVPLPATFTIEAGRRISDSKTGMQVRLYSDFPFPWRTDDGARDDFDAEALRRLRENPHKPQYQFTELDGRPVLRYATARVMQPSCLNCHNTRPDSPKRDWKVGDVRGVLEIVRPLHKDVARVREGLRGSFVLMIAVSMLLLGLGVLALVLGGASHRRRIASAVAAPR